MAPIFEPEETIGHYWHRLVGGSTSWPHHPDAVVRLGDIRGRLGVVFRALGGADVVRLMAVGSAVSGVVQNVPFPGTPEIDRALMVKGILDLGVTLT
jgi:nitric oxide reductase NorD protein